MNNQETVVLGGGCFWCMEAVFQQVNGVKSVVSGYAGGTTNNPTYKEVCTGTTGHAEVVQITYDTTIVSFKKVLETFWNAHDPTTFNRQGGDYGTQYRSVIYYHSERQRIIAASSKAERQKMFQDAIVTEIKPLNHFYPAEEYHQNYFKKHPNESYCVFVIKPKLEHLKVH